MRDRVFVILGAVIASIVVERWADYRAVGATPEAHLWHDVMVYSQKAARQLGRVGMYAERRYYEEVRTHVGQ